MEVEGYSTRGMRRRLVAIWHTQYQSHLASNEPCTIEWDHNIIVSGSKEVHNMIFYCTYLDFLKSLMCMASVNGIECRHQIPESQKDKRTSATETAKTYPISNKAMCKKAISTQNYWQKINLNTTDKKKMPFFLLKTWVQCEPRDVHTETFSGECD